MMPVALYCAFLYAPKERVMGVVQRIFYFHVSSAWTSLFSFFFVFVGGALYLVKKDKRMIILPMQQRNLEYFFAQLCLVTGPIWAKPVWNVWWTWDPRLTSTFVLWLIFVAYLILRSSLAIIHQFENMLRFMESLDSLMCQSFIFRFTGGEQSTRV